MCNVAYWQLLYPYMMSAAETSVKFHIHIHVRILRLGIKVGLT